MAKNWAYECLQVMAERDKLRFALQALVDALADNDEDGLTEFADIMVAARAALTK